MSISCFPIEDSEGGEGEQKKRQKRGGKGVIKTKKKESSKKQHICLSRASRGKKKYVTVVTGLATYGTITSSILCSESSESEPC